jgi:hypothetical protein
VVCFFEVLASSFLGGHNFLNSISFLMSFCALEAPIGGVQIMFGHQEKWNPSFGFGLP